MRIKKLIQQANNGDIDSMNELAYRYTSGDGVDINYKEAFKYLQLAVKFGNPLAMANLAIYYSRGVCGEKDYHMALKLFSHAACMGANIRNAVFENIGIDTIKTLAFDGDSVAEYYYALALGAEGKEEKWSFIKSAAEKKMPLALCSLGIKFFLENPTKDNEEAKTFFQQAVDYGYDYYEMLNVIEQTEQQIGPNCNMRKAVRVFLRESRERPIILVKVQKRSRAEKFIANGEVYIQPLENFRKSDKSGVGDQYEGVANTGLATSFWEDIQQQEALSERLRLGMYDEYMAHERLFCLYALEFADTNDFIAPDVRMRQFGDTAVIIWDGKEFFHRLENGLKKVYGDCIWIGYKRVEYDVIFSESQSYTEFSKTEPYAWQHEFRFVIDIANGRLEKMCGTSPNQKNCAKKLIIK